MVVELTLETDVQREDIMPRNGAQQKLMSNMSICPPPQYSAVLCTNSIASRITMSLMSELDRAWQRE
jgi:hypothetical protein